MLPSGKRTSIWAIYEYDYDNEQIYTYFRA